MLQICWNHFFLLVFSISQEMWALFDFVTHGSILGTIKTFMMEYGNPITRVRPNCPLKVFAFTSQIVSSFWKFVSKLIIHQKVCSFLKCFHQGLGRYMFLFFCCYAFVNLWSFKSLDKNVMCTLLVIVRKTTIIISLSQASFLC